MYVRNPRKTLNLGFVWKFGAWPCHLLPSGPLLGLHFQVWHSAIGDMPQTAVDGFVEELCATRTTYTFLQALQNSATEPGESNPRSSGSTFCLFRHSIATNRATSGCCYLATTSGGFKPLWQPHKH